MSPKPDVRSSPEPEEHEPLVWLCAGSDCQKKRKANARLLEALAGRARVVPARCQKVCEGPVIGLQVDGELQWFGKVKGKAVRQALQAFLDQGELRKPLKGRVIKKRSGKLR